MLQVAVDQMTMVQDGLEAAYGPLVHWRAPDELYASDQTSKSVFRPAEYSGMLQLSPEQMALLEEEATRQEAEAIAQAILDNTEPAERTLRLDLIQSAAQEAVELAGRLALTGSGSAAIATYIAAITEKESFESLFNHLFGVPSVASITTDFDEIWGSVGNWEFEGAEDLLKFVKSPLSHPILGRALDFFANKLGLGEELDEIRETLGHVGTGIQIAKFVGILSNRSITVVSVCVGGAPLGVAPKKPDIEKENEPVNGAESEPDPSADNSEAALDETLAMEELFQYIKNYQKNNEFPESNRFFTPKESDNIYILRNGVLDPSIFSDDWLISNMHFVRNETHSNRMANMFLLGDHEANAEFSLKELGQSDYVLTALDRENFFENVRDNISQQYHTNGTIESFVRAQSIGDHIYWIGDNNYPINIEGYEEIGGSLFVYGDFIFEDTFTDPLNLRQEGAAGTSNYERGIEELRQKGFSEWWINFIMNSSELFTGTRFNVKEKYEFYMEIELGGH